MSAQGHKHARLLFRSGRVGDWGGWIRLPSLTPVCLRRPDKRTDQGPSQGHPCQTPLRPLSKVTPSPNPNEDSSWPPVPPPLSASHGPGRPEAPGGSRAAPTHLLQLVILQLGEVVGQELGRYHPACASARSCQQLPEWKQEKEEEEGKEGCRAVPCVLSWPPTTIPL